VLGEKGGSGRYADHGHPLALDERREERLHIVETEGQESLGGATEKASRNGGSGEVGFPWDRNRTGVKCTDSCLA